MRRFVLSTALLAASFSAMAEDAKPKPKAPPRIAINEPNDLKTDADYAIQGEYLGEMEHDGNKFKLGVQVIARGNGKFALVGFKDGLPGAGWDGEVVKLQPVAVRTDDKVVVTKSAEDTEAIGSIEKGVLTLEARGAKGTLKKVTRTSPTLGAKPPEGAHVLFNGASDLDNWDGGKLAELSDGKFLAATNPRSKKTFQSFTAHVEFRLAWMPNATGQGRSNSGVYVQDRYELQVLDSFGLSGENNECGGFYTISKPKVNMCLPPMVWQTYDIDFTAATFDADKKKTKPAIVTVKHNGVVVQDALELPKFTPGGKFGGEVPEPGAMFFQNHGDPVVFNNVWVVDKK